MNRLNITLYITGVVAVLGIGYVAYFDHKRRNDPAFKKPLQRERRIAARKVKVTKEKEEEARVKLIEKVVMAAAHETYPRTLEDMQKYFTAQVAEGQYLCDKGEEFYDDAVLPFYKATKVYPDLLELIDIYRKSLPQCVFENVVSILSIEQQAVETQSSGGIPVL